MEILAVLLFAWWFVMVLKVAKKEKHGQGND